jgi:hypothetical protein
VRSGCGDVVGGACVPVALGVYRRTHACGARPADVGSRLASPVRPPRAPVLFSLAHVLLQWQRCHLELRERRGRRAVLTSAPPARAAALPRLSHAVFHVCARVSCVRVRACVRALVCGREHQSNKRVDGGDKRAESATQQHLQLPVQSGFRAHLAPPHAPRSGFPPHARPQRRLACSADPGACACRRGGKSNSPSDQLGARLRCVIVRHVSALVRLRLLSSRSLALSR